MMLLPKNSRNSTTSMTHGPPLTGPRLSALNHEPTRLSPLGPVSQRFVSRSAPQIAQPAANGLTGSLQLGHRLRSGIVEQDGATATIIKPDGRLGKERDEAGHHERARPQPF